MSVVEVPRWAVHFVLDSAVVDVDGIAYSYCVVSNTLFHVKNFLGFPEAKFLFISEDVPEEFREYMLRHEVREFTQRAGQEDRCLATLKQELQEIPAEIRQRYIEMRLKLFQDLVAHYATEQDEALADIKRQLSASLAHLETL